jgi:hypothetical protein
MLFRWPPIHGNSILAVCDTTATVNRIAALYGSFKPHCQLSFKLTDVSLPILDWFTSSGQDALLYHCTMSSSSNIGQIRILLLPTKITPQKNPTLKAKDSESHIFLYLTTVPTTSRTHTSQKRDNAKQTSSLGKASSSLRREQKEKPTREWQQSELTKMPKFPEKPNNQNIPSHDVSFCRHLLLYVQTHIFRTIPLLRRAPATTESHQRQGWTWEIPSTLRRWLPRM